MVKERQQQRASEREQKDIYNLVHSDENERLKNTHSLYTAYDLGDKNIPQEYQGMTYEQVDASIKQKEAEEKARQKAKATRDELLAKAVRKSIGRPEDYHLSQLQINNLSAQFDEYNDDQLREYVSGTREVQPEISEPIQQSYEQTSEVEKGTPAYDAPLEYSSEQHEYKVDPKSLETQKTPEKREELDFSSLLVEDKKRRLVSQIINGMDSSE